MIEIYDRNRVKKAILENAFHIEEDLQLNSIYTLTFSLPYSDPKNKFCQPFWLAWFNGNFYRIQPAALRISDTGAITYTCEHVIATLIDKSLFGYYHVGGLGVYTSDVLRWLLSFQKDWKLGQCDFSRQFEYGWEQETLLSAFFSVPNRFTELYMWDYDTTNYPWTVHLKKINKLDNPKLYIRNVKNILSLQRSSDTREVCTRLYPLGYGEGINQLTIKDVNNGLPYLQSPAQYVQKYGIIERVWIDRRYEDAESLKQAAQAMLDELQEPIEEYEISMAELQGGEYDQARLGKIARIIDSRVGIDKTTYITGIYRKYDNVTESKITIATKPSNIASTVADMADRQRIEAAYAQGATQIYSQSLQANSDAKSGAVLDFFIPDEMRIINKVLVKIRMESFRAFSKATEGGGDVTQTGNPSSKSTTLAGGGTTISSGASSNSTTSSGGSSVTTSGASSSSTTNSGGGSSTTSGASSSSTTSSGGGGSTTSGSSSQTTTGGGKAETTSDFIDDESGGHSWTEKEDGDGVHRHGYTIHLPHHSHRGAEHTHGMKHTHHVDYEDHSHGMSHTHNVSIPSHSHGMSHTHNVSIPSHTHGMSHTHNVSIPSHTHDMTHTHQLKIPAHTHSITPGIYRFGNPKSFTLYVNRQAKGTFNSTTAELDITNYLVGETGKIPRGNWQSLEIRPNDLAHISIVLYIQGFVQSRGDMTV